MKVLPKFLAHEVCPTSEKAQAHSCFAREYQRLHDLSKYWYSVTSTDSPYYGRASVIYSDLHDLRRRVYRVRVNHSTANPRIIENLGEVVATDDSA